MVGYPSDSLASCSITSYQSVWHINMWTSSSVSSLMRYPSYSSTEFFTEQTTANSHLLQWQRSYSLRRASELQNYSIWDDEELWGAMESVVCHIIPWTLLYTAVDKIYSNSTQPMGDVCSFVLMPLHVTVSQIHSNTMGDFNFWLSLSLSLTLSENLSWTLKSGLTPKFNLTSV